VNKLRACVSGGQAEAPRPGERRVTSKARPALVHTLMRSTRLLSDARRILPARKDPTQGFPAALVLSTLIHGLLSADAALSATRPAAEDEPLLKLLGVERAPAAETVEHVLKYWRSMRRRAAALLECWLARACGGGPESAQRRWSSKGCRAGVGDGSRLEVEGKHFDAIKIQDGRRAHCAGDICRTLSDGVDFAGEGVAKRPTVRQLLERTVLNVLRPFAADGPRAGVADALYGDGPVLTIGELSHEAPA